MTDVSSLLRSRYPALAAIPNDRLARDLATVRILEVPAQSTLFRETEPCAGFPFVIDGEVRVTRGAPDGRELELYRVRAGEVCIVSTSCLLGSLPMSARGVAAATTRLAMVDRATLAGWLAFDAVRLFVLGLMADRLAELMALVEAVAFHRLDQRLAGALLGHGRTLRATHQELADALGTAREMVSRLLKRFEEQGAVRVGRERIEIVDAPMLRALAGQSAPARL